MATLYYQPEESSGGGEDQVGRLQLDKYKYIFEADDGDYVGDADEFADGEKLDNAARRRYARDEEELELDEHDYEDYYAYRTAIRRMSSEMLSLYTRVKELEKTNKILQIDRRTGAVTMAHATPHPPPPPQRHHPQLQSLSKTDLLSNYVETRNIVAQKEHELQQYKKKVRALQNQLIEQNEKEANFLRVNHAHATQLGMVQSLKRKAKQIQKLEESVRQHELIIQNMENRLEGGPKNTSATSKQRTQPKMPLATVPEVDSAREKGLLSSLTPRVAVAAGVGGGDDNGKDVAALQLENDRLKRQIAQFEQSKHQNSKVVATRNEEPPVAQNHIDEMWLYLLENVEDRILSLHKQMRDSFKLWRKEKEELEEKISSKSTRK